MPALLRGPAADPVDPRAIALAEHPVDEPVVRGQVVLGQEADLERRLGDARQARLVGRPGLLVEVTAEAVRDEVVGEPLLRDLGVTVVQAAGLRLELLEQGHVHGQGPLVVWFGRTVDRGHGAPRDCAPEHRPDRDERR